MRIFYLILLTTLTVGLWAADATIVNIYGSVEIKEPGGTWQVASEGQVCSTDSIISTGFNSRSILTVGGMKLTLSPLTRVSIDSLSEEEDTINTSLSLKSGRLRASSNQLAQRKTRRTINFKVNTPVATAAVRGTDFLLSTNKLVTLEGMVELARGNRVVLAPAGSKSWVAPDVARPTPPIEQVGETISPEITAAAEEASPVASPSGNINIKLK